MRLTTTCLLITLGPATAAAAPPANTPSVLARPVISVSGGVQGFIAPALRDHAGDGGAWRARITAGGRKRVRLELTYAGSAQPLDAMDGSLLLSDGVLGTVRINVAPWTSDIVEPFMYLGAGWTRFHVRSQAATAALTGTDNVLDMPFGCGAARRYAGMVFEVRGGLNIISGADLLPIMRDPSSSRHSEVMHGFEILAGVGFEI